MRLRCNYGTPDTPEVAGRRTLRPLFLSFLWSPLLILFRNRTLLRQTVSQEIRKRYVGSVLGLLWTIAQPLLFLGIYAAVFVLIFKVRFELFDSNEYVLLIFCGLLPFLGFAEALSTGVGAVVANAGLIKNTLFPIELVPVKALLSSQVTQVVGTIMLVLAIASVKGLGLMAWFVPVLWLAQLLFMAGMLWILSGLNVFFRDLQQIVASLILLLMMLSPIAYTLDMVPEGLRLVVNANPIAHFIFCNQSLLILNEAPPETSLWFVSISSVAMFLLGYAFFRRLKTVFVDHV